MIFRFFDQDSGAIQQRTKIRKASGQSMEAKVVQSSFQLSTWMNLESVVWKPNSHSLHFAPRFGEKQRHPHHQIIISCQFQPRKAAGHQRRAISKVSCLPQNIRAQVLESEPALSDDVLTLKTKSEEIEPYLDGRCIYLVGMMGSGKTTVGRVLSEALGYSFFDCDKLIEQAVGIPTVAQIFKKHGESFFRDNETEVLRKLSLMNRVVVSTGGGAVVRPINWKHMQKGISVFLDVPLEALARRITKDGTQSRPLLYDESGDAYERTLSKLLALWEERGEAYIGADARVSLENIAAKLGYDDVCKISPIAIANEALAQIECILKR